jgi:hypothetical protein
MKKQIIRLPPSFPLVVYEGVAGLTVLTKRINGDEVGAKWRLLVKWTVKSPASFIGVRKSHDWQSHGRYISFSHKGIGIVTIIS